MPIVGHLHGTELLMLEAIEDDPHRWPLRPGLGRAAARLGRAGAAADRADRDRQSSAPSGLLGIDADRCVLVPNGFNPEHFGPRHLDHARSGADARRAARLGAGRPTVATRSTAFDDDDPVLLYVGRFTEVKRIPLLIEAYERARPGFNRARPARDRRRLPGRVGGRAPAATRSAASAPSDVFLAGWHDHHELPDILAATDVIVLPSVREQFGQVLVEGMACGLPAIAVDAYGPADIVDHGETGWLVEPDDVDALANALVEAVNRPAERRRRGANAAACAHERYAWPALAQRVAEIYDDAVDATSLRDERRIERLNAASHADDRGSGVWRTPDPLLPFSLPSEPSDGASRPPTRRPPMPERPSGRDRPLRPVLRARRLWRRHGRQARWQADRTRP